MKFYTKGIPKVYLEKNRKFVKILVKAHFLKMRPVYIADQSLSG